MFLQILNARSSFVIIGYRSGRKRPRPSPNVLSHIVAKVSAEIFILRQAVVSASRQRLTYGQMGLKKDVPTDRIKCNGQGVVVPNALPLH